MRRKGIGYVLAGPVGVTGFFGGGASSHVGAGGELLLRDRFTVGAEIGLMSYAALFAANGGIRFVRDGNRRLVPFASGGYFKWFSNEGSFDGMNVAAGADYWFNPPERFSIKFLENLGFTSTSDRLFAGILNVPAPPWSLSLPQRFPRCARRGLSPARWAVRRRQ